MLFDVSKLKHLGKNVKIGDFVKIARPEVISIGDNTIIDDFTLITGGEGVTIGKYVHISSFCSVSGGGEFTIEDFAGLSAGCFIISGSDDYTGKCMTNPTVPQEYKTHVLRAHTIMKKHSILGTNTVVLPGVTIGEGAATGAKSLVRSDLKPWSIYVGSPARFAKKREKENILRMEKELLKKYETGEDQPARPSR